MTPFAETGIFCMHSNKQKYILTSIASFQLRNQKLIYEHPPAN